jgi:hypothetical protein
MRYLFATGKPKMHDNLVNRVNESIAMDDSCNTQLWMRGDLLDDRFKEACEAFLRQEYGNEAWERVYAALVRDSMVRRAYRRTVPLHANHIVGNSQYVDSDTPGRGATPAMILEEWLPMFPHVGK